MIHLFTVTSFSSRHQVRFIRWYDFTSMPMDMEKRRDLLKDLHDVVDKHLGIDPNSACSVVLQDNSKDGCLTFTSKHVGKLRFNAVYVCTPENLFILLTDASELPFRYVDFLYECVEALMPVLKTTRIPTDELLTFNFQKVYNLFDQLIVAGRIRDT